MGDQLDRGDSELQILYMLERLQDEARAAGGALHVLVGNHETMNAEGRFRYSTPRSTELFGRWQSIEAMAAAWKVSAQHCFWENEWSAMPSIKCWHAPTSCLKSVFDWAFSSKVLPAGCLSRLACGEFVTGPLSCLDIGATYRCLV